MKNQLTLKTPASWMGGKWREALPTGNGTIAAAVYGGVHNETVLLTHDDLWHEVITEELPDVSERLPEVRKLLADNKAYDADPILEDALKSKGYGANIGAPLPLGDLKVNMPISKGFTEYERVLEMQTGEVRVSWHDSATRYERRVFTSRTDDCVVMQITANGEAPLKASITLDLHDRADLPTPNDDEDPKLPTKLDIKTETDGWIFYAAQNDDQTDFGAVARVSSNAGQIITNQEGIQINSGSQTVVVLKVFIKGERKSEWERLKAEISELSCDYTALLTSHAREHQELFDRVQLDLCAEEQARSLSNESILLEAYQGEVPTTMIEKMWAYGRYLLIISSREGSQPCPLQGKWCGFYRGYWTFNMANENLQMNYWQAMTGNMVETTLPVFDYFERMLPDFRENARKIFGCGGIVVPCITTPPSGLFKDIQPHTLQWTGAAAWIAQHFYDYYLHTGDETFLKERALPFLREIVLFYKDFFTIDENGYFLSAPSNSPENFPGNHGKNGEVLKGMGTTMNATMDFALAKEVLTNLIDGYKQLGEEPEELKTWRDMLTKIAPYQINDEGAITEWMHPYYTDNYKHRHQSHIYPVFPGYEVTEDSDIALFEAFKVAIRKRLEVGISSQTGWSLAHMANVYARMKEGDSALECLSLIARACVMNNFYTTHNDWRDSGIGCDFSQAPYQIDANFGWTAAIQEMLLFSKPGHITILPALPEKWPKGSISGLLARGGISVSIQWDLSKSQIVVELCSLKKDQTIALVSPHNRSKQMTVELKLGAVETITISAV